MISSFNLLGRTAPLTIYAPAQLQPILENLIATFCASMDYEVLFRPIDTTKLQVIYEDRSLTVESIPLNHRLPCAGFLFREKPTLPHIRRDMIDFYDIPISQINNIKNGADWVDDEGKVIPNNRLVSPADPPRSYAYCSDTKYIPDLHKMLKGVSTLYHESTYLSADVDRANMYFHSTAAQAAQVAKDAGVGQLLLGHYSAKCEDETLILNEAKTIFPNSRLSDEGMVIEV